MSRDCVGRITGVIGRSQSGKTTLLVKIAAEYLLDNASANATVALLCASTIPVPALAAEIRELLSKRDPAAIDEQINATLHRVTCLSADDAGEFAQLFARAVDAGCTAVFIDDVATLLPGGPHTSAAATRFLAQLRSISWKLLMQRPGSAVIVTLPAKSHESAPTPFAVGGPSTLVGLCDRLVPCREIGSA